ncbi:NAD+ diphosphatase [Aliiroseovarius halocynthiae]|uniref:NAD(+) diphosphatase n=1 Tax=Aliiroseovarius halocynthiae TaxID=985055 RepID=A0A545SZN6_9RHOB|nr:NAD(+) diphosphatase [Aliiroseovarius halocynthiae]TQV70427.1 NAD(+) diphosphatase [Aliiroseovarius halocynthiae]SMR81856.1 NAD+ diphosphatase [Aliiroseovarius halocynthiae]
MKIAEQVTFAAGSLNRDAESRGNTETQAVLTKNAKLLPLWQGKILMQPAADGWDLSYLSQDTLPADFATASQVYLGLQDGTPLFALDVSEWEPQDNLPDTAQFLDNSIQCHPDLPEDRGFFELRATMAGLTPNEAEVAATARSILEWHRIHGFCANCGARTHVSMAGWQRDCDACGRSHFPRTDPVVIMLITHGNSVLVGRGVGWPDDMYSLLAGFVEPGETIETATRREVLEEVGVTVGPVGYLASQPWPYPSSLMIGTWGHATSTEIKLDPTELSDALWITREDMLDIFSGRNPKIKPARKGAIAHFLMQNWLADRLD